MSNDSNIENAIYPLTFHPTFKDYPWGGRNLETRLGRVIPDGIVAESWEIAGHPNGSSIVKCGELSGLTLPQVQAQLGEALVGQRNRAALESERFPLLIKLLDANRWLSVQVHPDDAYGLANEGEPGKTEMWVVVHAEAGAEIIYGFREGVTRERFSQAIADEDVESCLHRMAVQAGDVIFVPAGSIHALGPGIMVAEIQQNSDTTYRIYDWGRPRPIHVDQALEVLNFDLVEPAPAPPQAPEEGGIQRREIARCDYFETERISLPAACEVVGECSGETFEIWAVLDGSATVTWSGKPVRIESVGWVLLPATLGEYAIEADSDSVLLRVATPAAS